MSELLNYAGQFTTAAPLAFRGKSRKRQIQFSVPADMTLYSALAGKEPRIDPSLADPLVAATEAVRQQPWSPILLSLYLKQVCHNKATHLNKPELTAWLKKKSTVARQRFRETQSRVLAAHKRRAA